MLDQENFILNDIILRVNPTDIQSFDQKFVDTETFIRENSTHSYSSVSSIATYSVTIAFDLNNAEDKNNAVAVCAELSKYPFVFIKSGRLDQFVPMLSKRIDEYNMFAVKQWTIHMEQRAKRTMFLSMDLHYFCHTPYVNDYRFLTYEQIELPINSKVENSRNVAPKFKLSSVDNLYESKIFQDFFRSDIKEMKEKFDSVFSRQGSLREISFAMPILLRDTPENKKVMEDIIASNYINTGFEDVDVKAFSFVNNHKTNETRSDELSYLIAYQDVNVLSLEDNDTGDRLIDVQSITLVRKNTIVANQLQGHSAPFIQYLGRSPAEMKVVMSINNQNIEYTDENSVKPYELLSASIRRAEQLNTVNGNKLPFKSMRIRSSVNILGGANYFVLSNESSFESSDDQGNQVVSMVFMESDLTNLVGNKNLKLASKSTRENNIVPMLKTMKLIFDEYEIGGQRLVPYDLIKGIEARRNLLESNAMMNVRPPSGDELALLEISKISKVTDDEASYILGTNKDVEKLSGILARVVLAVDTYANHSKSKLVRHNLTYLDLMNDATREIERLLKGYQDKSIDRESIELSNLMGVVAEALNGIIGLQAKEDVSPYDKKFSILAAKAMSSATNPGFEGGFNEIKEQGMLDINVFESLIKGYKSNNDSAISYLGEKDARKFSPFFFLVQDPYVDEVSLYSMYQYIDETTKNALSKIRTVQGSVDLKFGSSYLSLSGSEESQRIDSAYDKKRNNSKSPLLGKALANSKQLSESAEEAYQTWLTYKKARPGNKLIAKFDFTKEYLTDIIQIESGGDRNAHTNGSSYYGLFQVDFEKITRSGGDTTKWNDIPTNTNAALKYWFDYVIPTLVSKKAERIGLNANSPFNFYMMHQQGPDGWLDAAEAYSDESRRHQKPVGKMAVRMRNNAIGYLARHKSGAKKGQLINPFNGTINEWVNLWINHYHKKTGSVPIIFGNVVQTRNTKNATQDTAIGKLYYLAPTDKPAPPGLKVSRKIQIFDKKYNGIAPPGSIHVVDADTIILLASSGVFYEDGVPIRKNVDLRVGGLDAQETNHLRAGHPVGYQPTNQDVRTRSQGQTYADAAKRIMQGLVKVIRFPLSTYNTGESYGREVSLVISDNNIDLTYEIIKNGYAVPSAQKSIVSGEITNDIYRIYKQAGDAARKNRIGAYASLPELEEGDSDRNTSTSGIKSSSKAFIDPLSSTIVSADNIDVPIAYDTVPKSIDLIKRSDELSELTTIPSELRPGDGLLTKRSGIKFEGFETDKIYEFNENHQAQYRCSRTGRYLSTGLDLAIPVVKIYIVEGLRDDWLSRTTIIEPRETNLYEVGGISDVRIQTADDSNPVSVLVFSMSNPGSMYTDAAALSRQTVYESDFRETNIFPEFSDIIGKLNISSGTRLTVKMGYSNDVNELETVFNGEITEVEGEERLTIIAEGYGRELVAVNHSPYTVKKGGGFLNSSTSGMIAEMLASDEIFTFGTTYYITNSKNPVARNILAGITQQTIQTLAADEAQKEAQKDMGWLEKVGKFMSDAIDLLHPANGIETSEKASRDFLFGNWWEKSSELYTNVYSPVIEVVDRQFTTKHFWNVFSHENAITVNYPIHDSTPWDVLKEMQYRHPGTWTQVFNYKERATLFFGIKEQLFIATDPPISFFGKSSESFNTVLPELEPIRYKMFKPAADFHMISSDMNIISNQIKVYGGFKTKVDIRYSFDNPTLREHFVTSDEGIFDHTSMSIDDDLRPNVIRSTRLEMNGCDHPEMAFRYGANELKNQIERMYDGKIIIVGNPNMKAGDYAYLSDSDRSLYGVIKIRECSHIVNERDGYITVITPGLHAETSVYVYSHLFTKLGLAYTMASNKIKADAVTHITENRKIKYTSSILGIMASFESDSSSLTGGFPDWVRPAAAIGTIGIGGAAIGGYLGVRTLSYLATQSGALGAALTRYTASALLGASGILKLATGVAGESAIPILGRTLLFIGTLATGLAGTLAASLGALSIAAPIVIGSVLITSALDTVHEIEETRQPLVFMPLMNNGIAYQAGLAGFTINTYQDSFYSNYKKNREAAYSLYENTKDALFGRNESKRALAIIAKSKVSLPDTYSFNKKL